MKINGLYFSMCDDIGENKGGFYVQVYKDEDYTIQIDDFVIPSEQVNNNYSLALEWIKSYYF